MVENKISKWKILVHFCTIVYGLYSFFLLIEILDFLSLLHTKPPGYSPTYRLVHVFYFLVDLIICLVITFYYVLLPSPRMSNSYPKNLYGGILIAVFRMIIIYYLYIYTTPKYRWVPYIYKTANEFSNFVRILFLPSQIILGLVTSWFWWKNSRNERLN